MSILVSVRKQLGDFRIDAEFASRGHVTAIFGCSGAGKTTLVDIIAGLLRPDEGTVKVDDDVLVDIAAGVIVPARRRRVGYVFQDSRPFPHMLVRSNLLYGRHAAPDTKRWAHIDPIVDLLGIGHLLDRRPASLSGGEKQRVAIGRALLAAPQLLLMDEPMAAIDQSRQSEILPYLDRLRSEMHLPIVYVSHAVEEIARIADTVVVVDAGRVLATGPTADILTRLDLAPLAETEPGVILAATVTIIDTARQVATVAHPAGQLSVPGISAPIGSEVRLRIHARDVAIAIGELGRLSIRNRLPATITEITSADTAAIDLKLDIAGSTLLARLTADAVEDLGLTTGSKVTALIKAMASGGVLTFSPI